MCGIIGYSSKKKDAKDVVIAGLKNLEYRGYDSAGIATTNENGKIMLYKAKGKIANLEEKLETEKIYVYASSLGSISEINILSVWALKLEFNI